MTDLGEVMKSIFSYEMEDVNTAMPGIVLAVHNNGQELFVDVQPSVSKITQTDEVIHRSVILNVQVMMPSSNNAGIIFPVDVGDTMLLVFSQTGIENFKYGDGRPTAPNDYRTFSIRDCVAIPGLFPKSAAVNRVARHKLPHNPKDVVVFHNLGSANETEIRLEQGSGNIAITSPAAVVVNCKTATVNASDSMSVKTKDFTIDCTNYKVNSSSYVIGTGSYSMNATTSATSTGTFSHNGSWKLNGIAMESHNHGGVQAGGDSTGGPQ